MLTLPENSACGWPAHTPTSRQLPYLWAHLAIAEYLAEYQSYAAEPELWDELLSEIREMPRAPWPIWPIWPIWRNGRWAAILILRYLNKASGMNATYHQSGASIRVIAAALSSLLAVKSPDDPDHARALAAIRSNLGPPMPSLRVRLTAPLEGVEGLKEDGDGIAYLAIIPVMGSGSYRVWSLLQDTTTRPLP